MLLSTLQSLQGAVAVVPYCPFEPPPDFEIKEKMETILNLFGS